MAIKKLIKMPTPVKIGGPMILQGGGLVMMGEKDLDFHTGAGGKPYTSSPMHQSAEDLLMTEITTKPVLSMGTANPHPFKMPNESLELMTDYGMLKAEKIGTSHYTATGPLDKEKYPEEFLLIFAEVLKKGIADELKKAIAPHPAMATFDKKEGTAQIGIKHADGTISTAQEPVTTPKLFTAPACNVGVSSKLTIPIAPYTNAQVSVSLNIPCTHGEIDQVYDYALNWVDERMTALKKKIDQAKGVSG